MKKVKLLACCMVTLLFTMNAVAWNRYKVGDFILLIKNESTQTINVRVEFTANVWKYVKEKTYQLRSGDIKCLQLKNNTNQEALNLQVFKLSAGIMSKGNLHGTGLKLEKKIGKQSSSEGVKLVYGKNKDLNSYLWNDGLNKSDKTPGWELAKSVHTDNWTLFDKQRFINVEDYNLPRKVLLIFTITDPGKKPIEGGLIKNKLYVNPVWYPRFAKSYISNRTIYEYKEGTSEQESKFDEQEYDI